MNQAKTHFLKNIESISEDPLDVGRNAHMGLIAMSEQLERVENMLARIERQLAKQSNQSSNSADI